MHFLYQTEIDRIFLLGPLMCAGITTYSPLKKHNVGKDSKVA
jgi:D-arabinose 1-dehydrogenase-like Zn-dependent alcohol dehydrogenase